MATIHKEIPLQASAEKVWAVVRDLGAVHQRFVPGLVTDVRLETGARIVTFANGMVVRELIVTLDDHHRRLAYAAKHELFQHHNASMQVIAEGPEHCRLIWITDLLPDTAASAVGKLVEEGAAIMKRTLERNRAA